ncbi:hypothetical protein SAMN04488511_11998 [Pedobacter suwonensis]|uniref:Uncharacterized protein n=1 Tax=Pedobacter suwonensis TaxID=332999 RepID=A0A1I0U3B2_9SPHI|nr:hypothetical protein [Pedobacter suwonensis]SFA58542.1 hypothetical protein SAMN04488511_11998 [Pedobacter suwonensis]
MLELEKEKKILYPILIVDNLSKSFGKIDKTNTDTGEKLSQNEKFLLTLIARIFIEITLNEEL